MAKVIKVKKGLDINLKGKAKEVDIPTVMGESYGVIPDHYPGLTPKLAVKAGDKVKAGTALLYDKKHPELKVVSPVSGEVVEVHRGLKRKILSVEVKSDGAMTYEAFDTSKVKSMDRAQLLELLLSSGMMALVRTRPYDYIPDPTVTPRDIFITAQYTAPLTPDAEEVVTGDLPYLQGAIDVLAKLTTGKVYVGVRKGSKLLLENCEIYEVDGPHPAGNVGVLINKVKPVNKGETVWTLSIAELAFIGRFLATGHTDFSKKVAFAGSRLATTGYSVVVCGADILSMVANKIDSNPAHYRIIDGDVLTGTLVTEESRYMNPRSSVITAIPEGDDVHEFFGWASLGFNKFSFSRTFPTFLMGKKKEYDIDARFCGGRRALIVSNEYDQVFPMDIYPEYLIRAIITFDIDKMEALGIYEIAPEDFALCEFVDTSKMELQYLVRKGLDELYKEMN